MIDTNIRFHKVSIDRVMRKLNLNVEDGFVSNNALVALDYKTAYSLRKKKFVQLRNDGALLPPEKVKLMQESNLNDFVCNYRYSYKHCKEGTKMWIYPRTKRYRTYSDIDPTLAFADRLYPLLHIPKFYPRKNKNPEHPEYAQWCKYALIRYKPWVNDPTDLFKKYAPGKTLEEISQETPHIFVDAWNDFVSTDARGQEVTLRIRSYLDENSCEKSGKLRDFVENAMCEDPLLAGMMLGAGLMGTIPEEHSRRILLNPPDWKEQRAKTRSKYSAEQIEIAKKNVEKNRREGNAGTRKIKFVDPDPKKNQMDDDQRLI